MKKLLPLLLLIAFALLATGCNEQKAEETSATKQTNYSQIAITAISKLTGDDLSGFYQLFDEEMKKSISENDLKTIWNNLITQYGSFQYYSSDFTLSSQDGYTLATIPCAFQNQTIAVLITLNSAGEISGLYFTESTDATNSPRLENDTAVTIVSGDYHLPGSLTMPEGNGPFPVVILVHGSGPSDRNEQIGPNLPFLDIAEQLAQSGIATLRYDKRTYAYREEMAELTDLTVDDEVIDDVAAAVAFVNSLQTIDHDRIYIAGHSLGGYLIPRIAQRTPEAQGYMMLAAAARPMEDLLLEQTNYILELDKETAQETKDALLEQTEATVNNIKQLTADSDLSAEQLMNVPASYWLDLQNYNPLTQVLSIEQPLLIMQGGRDYQVTSTDYDLWKEALKNNSNATFCYYDNLNHLFMPGTGKSTPTEYQSKGTVHEDVIQDMVAFIQRSDH